MQTLLKVHPIELHAKLLRARLLPAFLAARVDPCVTCLPVASPSNGGNCTIRGATRRRHAEGRLLMLQNPHHYPWCHAPSLVQDCPAGANKRRKGIAGNDKGTPRAASSAVRLVADEAKPPIRKIHPQPIRCNPPNQVEPSQWSQPPSATRACQRHRHLRQQCRGSSRDQHVLSYNPSFARDFPETCTWQKFTSLELQQFWAWLNVQLIELHARLLRPDPIATRVDPMRRVGVSGGLAWSGFADRVF